MRFNLYGGSARCPAREVGSGSPAGVGTGVTMKDASEAAIEILAEAELFRRLRREA